MKNLIFLIPGLFLFRQTFVPFAELVTHSSITVPTPILQSVRTKYPSATKIKFSVLEEGKIYKADFDFEGKTFSVVTSTKGIFNSLGELDKKEITATNSELTALNLKEGRLSDLRKLSVQGKSARQVGEYFLRGITYQFIKQASGEVNITPRHLAYETNSLEDLPDKIQAFIKERNKPNIGFITNLPLLEKPLRDYLSDKIELTFMSGASYILPDKSKQYEVLVKYYGTTDLPLIFDGNGDLLWVGAFNRLESLANFDDMSGGSTNVAKDDLGDFIGRFKANSALKDFVLDGSPSRTHAELNIYENQRGYQFRLLKSSDSGEQAWVLRYDSNKKLVDSYFSGRRQ